MKKKTFSLDTISSKEIIVWNLNNITNENFESGNSSEGNIWKESIISWYLHFILDWPRCLVSIKGNGPQGKRMTTFRSNFMTSSLKSYLFSILKKWGLYIVRLLGDVTFYPWRTECWRALALTSGLRKDWSLFLSMNNLAILIFFSRISSLVRQELVPRCETIFYICVKVKM